MNTTFTFRTDDTLKKQASRIYKQMGLDLSTALNIFMKQTVEKQRFPMSLDFDINVDPENTYPDYFFKLAGKGKNLGFDEEPSDILENREDIVL